MLKLPSDRCAVSSLEHQLINPSYVLYRLTIIRNSAYYPSDEFWNCTKMMYWNTINSEWSLETERLKPIENIIKMSLQQNIPFNEDSMIDVKLCV